QVVGGHRPDADHRRSSPRDPEQSSRTSAAFSPTWSPNCWYMPTIIASVGLIFSRAVLKHSRTSPLLPTRLPAARTLYTRQGFFVALTTLNIRSESEGR